MANALIQLRIDERLKAEAEGIADMTLDEINAEISAARKEV